MRMAAFDTVSPTPLAETLPIRLEQTSSRTGNLLMLALTLPIVLVMLVPFLMVLTTLVADPTARAVLAERPGTGVQIALGLALWSALFAWPLKRLFDNLVTSRTVTIASDLVCVEEASLFGVTTWSAPLASYEGLAHHVRASLSGTRHELILVHPARERSVLVAVADRLGERDIQRIAALLGTTQVPAATLYRYGAARRAKPRPAVAVETLVPASA